MWWMHESADFFHLVMYQGRNDVSPPTAAVVYYFCTLATLAINGQILLKRKMSKKCVLVIESHQQVKTYQ